MARKGKTLVEMAADDAGTGSRDVQRSLAAIVQGGHITTVSGEPVESKQLRTIKAAQQLGRHLHCPYCATNTVAPNTATYRFDCTRCEASWNTDGIEHTDGPVICPECGIPAAKPSFACKMSTRWHVAASVTLTDRYIDISDGEESEAS